MCNAAGYRASLRAILARSLTVGAVAHTSDACKYSTK